MCIKDKSVQIIIFLMFPLFFGSCLVVFCQEARQSITYQKGRLVEVALPVVLQEEDLGKAYPPSLTGLTGIKLVKGAINTNDEKRHITILKPYEDDLMLNLWGTGLGMYDERLDGQTPIRRARLAIVEIKSEKRITGDNIANLDSGQEYPLLLRAIDYGHAFHLTIAGSRKTFTAKVFRELEEALQSQKALEPILDKYDLSGTTAFYGLAKKKEQSIEIPLSWEGVEEHFVKANDPVPVFGEFLLVNDVESEIIKW